MTFAIFNENLSELLARLDVSEDETISRTAQITSSPVEDGADVNDHIRLEADSGSFSGLLLNDPGDADTVRERQATGALVDDTRASRAYSRLFEAHQNREIVTIITALEQLDNVVLTTLRGRQVRPGVLRVSGAYQVIRLAVTSQIELPKPSKRSQKSKTKRKGTTQTKPASESLKSKSISKILLDLARGK